MKAQLRKDYIQEKYVIIAPQRGKRPHDLERPERLRPPPPKGCIFCPQKINKVQAVLTVGPGRKQIYRQAGWSIKVVRNKYPAVTLNNPQAYGVQEVVIETPDHLEEFEDLSTGHVARLLEVYAICTKAISRNKNIEYILIFKNEGGRAGASIIHAHSQIFATSFLPPHLFDKSQKTQEYKLKYGRCVYCDVIKKEKGGPRFVWEDSRIIAFCPWASIHNYEIWILPKRHLDNITILSPQERISWAKILKRILQKINQLNLSYNFYFHQVIHDEDQHLYMKITPRGSIWAGVEIGSGVVVNPIPPEEAAKFYRNKI